MNLSPSQVAGVAHPIHQLVLVAMGMNIFDNCDLEALSAAAAERNRWMFLLTSAPIPLAGGTGSPLNPIATFCRLPRFADCHVLPIATFCRLPRFDR